MDITLVCAVILYYNVIITWTFYYLYAGKKI